MNNADKVYLELCEDILKNGVKKEDRTGTGTLSVFGRQLRFDLADGFPLLTTKKMPFRLILAELLFFIRGETELKLLLDNDVDIWTRDAYVQFLRESDETEERMTLDEFREQAKYTGYWLGPIYGSQWRDFNGDGIDQLNDAIEDLKYFPDSRRMVVSAWNPSKFDDMVLPPCHVMFQLYQADGKVSMHMYQRSADVFLGLGFNIASYALLLELIAAMTDLDVGELIISIGDAHLYTNHLEQVKTQLGREPKPLPKLNIIVPRDATIDSFDESHFYLSGYEPHGRLKGEQAY
jgi:thymidylate synthase